MASRPESPGDDAGAAVFAVYPLVERIVTASLGFSIGSAIGCFLRFAPFGAADPVPSILVGGLIGGLIGLVMPIRIGKPPMVELPRATPGAPVPVGALGAEDARALGRPQATSLLLGVAVGIGALPAALVVHLALDLRPSIVVIGALAIGAFLAAIVIVSLLPPFLLARPIRSALAVHIWLGAREFERAFGSRHAVDGFPADPAELGPWMTAHPETDASREAHVELHLFRGDWDAARAALDRMPGRTQREMATKAILEAILQYQRTGAIDDRAARAAAEAIPAGPERVEALVALAIFAARRRLPAARWREPLLEVRDLIPESDAAILLRDHGWVSFVAIVKRIWPVIALLAAMVVGSIMLVGGLGGSY